MICRGCHKDYPNLKFGKMGNGRQKKSCVKCCLKSKKNKTIDDKQKIYLYKVHKELHKYFRPQRRREYYLNSEYKQNLIKEAKKHNDLIKFMDNTQTYNEPEIFDPDTLEYL